MNILNTIQQSLKAPKGQMNSFGNYKYRSCEDILEAVKPLLGEATLQISDELVNIGDRYYIKAEASLSDGEKIWSTTAYAREAETKKGMDESQITGSASSYARKYALNGLFLIDDTKDADTMDNSSPDAKKPTSKTITPQSDTNTCPDCSSPLKMRQNGNGGYCPKKYPLTNPSCPPKPLSESDQKISDEIDTWPEPIPTILIDEDTKL